MAVVIRDALDYRVTVFLDKCRVNVYVSIRYIIALVSRVGKKFRL